MSDTPEPAPLTEREKAELACFHGAFGINHRALGRMRWLEAEVERMTAKCNAALDACDIAQRTLDGIDGVLSQRTAELAKSNAERDEARREVCELRADLRVNPTFKSQVAAERGWDCFDEKEGKP